MAAKLGARVARLVVLAALVLGALIARWRALRGRRPPAVAAPLVSPAAAAPAALRHRRNATPVIYDATSLSGQHCLKELSRYEGSAWLLGPAEARCRLPFASWTDALCVRAPHLCDSAAGTVPCTPMEACRDVPGVFPADAPAPLTRASAHTWRSTPDRALECARRPSGRTPRCIVSSDVRAGRAASAVVLLHIGLALPSVMSSAARRRSLFWPPERTQHGRRQLWAIRAVSEPPHSDDPLGTPGGMRDFDFGMGSYRSLLHDAFQLSYTLDWDAALAPVNLSSKLAAGAAWRRAPVLFASSNCHSLSGREAWVREFMQHMAVDSVGLCLNNRAGDAGTAAAVPQAFLMRHDLGNFGDAVAAKHALAYAYKFVLAIENTLAHDYVSEKFFDPLEAGAVAIYLGAPNVDDYAPGPGAFIDARGRTPADVAAEVAAADADDALYMRYHAWRRRGAGAARAASPLALLEARSVTYEEQLCRLCERAGG